MSVLGSIIVRHGCIMSPWLFNVYMDTSDRGENGHREEGREISEWKSRDCLASCMQITWFCMVSRRKT